MRCHGVSIVAMERMRGNDEGGDEGCDGES